MEIATVYPANPVKLLKALITKNSSRQQWDAQSNKCNQSDNVGQPSKVVSLDVKHGNKVQNKWYVHQGIDAIDTHVTIFLLLCTISHTFYSFFLSLCITTIYMDY